MQESVSGITQVNGFEVVKPDDLAEALTWLFADTPSVDAGRLQSYVKALKHEKIIRLDNGQYVVSSLFPPFPSEAFNKVINRGTNYPMTTYIVVSDLCPKSCDYCSYPRHGQEDLSVTQLRDIIAQLQDLGSPVIGFTGGEPLERPDLEEIIKSVDERSSTILFTSGRSDNDAPLTLERAKSLQKAGLFGLSVSLDHKNPAANDRVRFDGSHEAATTAIKNGVAAGLYTVASIVVTEENIDEIDEYIRFVGELGVHGINVFDRVPVNAAANQPALNTEMRKKLIALHQKVNADPALPQIMVASYIESQEMFGCGAGGITHMFINGQGRLQPCDFVPIDCGDLTQESLRDAFRRMREFFSVPCVDCITKAHGDVIKALADRQGNALVPLSVIKEALRKRMKCAVPGLYQ